MPSKTDLALQRAQVRASNNFFAKASKIENEDVSAQNGLFVDYTFREDMYTES